MDRSGRVVIPVRAREQLGIQAGQVLEVRVVEGARLELEPVGPPVRLVEEGGLILFDADEPIEPMSADELREAMERDRAEREGRWR